MSVTADRDEGLTQHTIAAWFRSISLAIFLALLAWAPFPLGSAVNWGAPVLEALTAICWMVWCLSLCFDSEQVWPHVRQILFPGIAALAVLIWIFLQTIDLETVLPAHPIWQMTTSLLHVPTGNTISINPWRTRIELLKLSSEAAAFLLAFVFSMRVEFARILRNAVIVMTSLYAAYAFFLVFFNTSQASLVYGVPVPILYVSGPFMLHNSFATFCGLGLLATVLGLFEMAGNFVVTDRGARPMLLSLLQFLFGRGSLLLVASLLLFGGLVASASRAGFVGTCLGLLGAGILALLRQRRSGQRNVALMGAAATLLLFAVLIAANGDILGARLTQLADAGTADDVRLALWAATERMISVFPWTGLGLGTFENAYPMFATKVLPFVLDKAHSDYLEFAAGIGLPAAILWCCTIAYLGFTSLRGALVRRRHHIYSLLSFAATVLVAFHSTVDFSLQIPAVAWYYCTIVGMGVAQSRRSKN